MNQHEELARYPGPEIIKKEICFGMVKDDLIEFSDYSGKFPGTLKQDISFSWLMLIVQTLEDLGFDVCVDFEEYFYQTED